MPPLTRSDLADLARYPASLQHAATALWATPDAGPIRPHRHPEPIKTTTPNQGLT